MGDLSKNFSRSEFKCPTCDADNISPALVADLQRLRDAIGSPLSITSGVRCKAHNKAVGGVEGSAHVPADLGDGEGEVGHAVDIAMAQIRRLSPRWQAAGLVPEVAPLPPKRVELTDAELDELFANA